MTLKQFPTDNYPVIFAGFFFGINKVITMKMSKGSEPSNKSGGMKSHIPASPGNNPGTSKSCDLSFSSKNKSAGSTSARHHTAADKSGV